MKKEEQKYKLKNIQIDINMHKFQLHLKPITFSWSPFQSSFNLISNF